MSQENATNILDANRRAMIISGKISEFQLNNLKGWPSLLFDNFTVSISYDFSPKPDDNDFMSAGSVTYDFIFKEGVELTDCQPKLKQLEEWVKTLFWKDTQVVFLKDGKEWI